MNKLRRHRWLALPKGLSYQGRVLSTGPIAYWPLNETSGTEAINYGSLGTAANGTLGAAGAAPTLGAIAAPGGGLAPSFDGSNDTINIYTAALNTSFPRTLGSMSIWWKVSAAGVWTDGTVNTLYRCFVDASNYVILRKSATNNVVEFFYNAGGTSETLTSTAYNNTSWNMMALTWTDAGDEVKWYNNGSQTGATQTGIGTFSGNLSTLDTAIGSAGTPASEVWSGNLAHAAIWNKVLTAAEIAALYSGGL
jgi:hypothetical protein